MFIKLTTNNITYWLNINKILQFQEAKQGGSIIYFEDSEIQAPSLADQSPEDIVNLIYQA